MIRKLQYHELKNSYTKENLESDIRKFILKDKNIKPDDYINWFEDVRKNIEFGLTIKDANYNVFVSTENNSFSSEFVASIVNNIAITEVPPPDLCYVYNFENPQIPKLLIVKNGLGSLLKFDMLNLINTLQNKLHSYVLSKEFKDIDINISSKYELKRNTLVSEITDHAKKCNFAIKTTEAGIYFTPLLNNIILTDDDFINLTPIEKAKIKKNTSILNNHASIYADKIKSYDKLRYNEIHNLKYTKYLYIIGHYINSLLKKYNVYLDITNYLLQVKEDILNNINTFIDSSRYYNTASDTFHSAEYSPEKEKNKCIFLKYKINLFVDNSKLKYAPVFMKTLQHTANLLVILTFYKIQMKIMMIS